MIGNLRSYDRPGAGDDPIVNSLEAYADPGSLPATQAGRLARLLGLGDAARVDDVSLARRIRAGLPTSVISALEQILGARRATGRLASEATLRRHKRRRTPLSRRHSERAYELGRVVDAVARAYRGDVARIEAFLTRPHPLLDGESPLDMATSCSAGADSVLRLVRRAEAGVAV